MELTGTVRDSDDNKPLPGATVEMWYGNIMLNRVAAGNYGIFNITTASSPDAIKVTHAGYKPGSFSCCTNSKVYAIDRDIVEGEPVIIKSILERKGGWWVLAGLLVFFLVAKKRT